MSENATAARVLAALPPGALLEECLVGLRAAGHVVEVAGSPALALARVEESDWDLVLIDSVLAMPGSLALLEGVKRRRPGTLVAMSGARLDGPNVRDAFRKGAYDVLFEPVARGELAALVEHAVRVRAMGEERRRLGLELETERRRARELAERLDHEDPFAAIVTATPGMRRLVATMREVARSDATVLLTGESGTGKGLLARAIHDGSFRKLAPFVEANCVVYSEGVLNSELFGHEKGAFTGAAKLKRGRFELAAGGTLFLDEIGEISGATQLLLLRVLQDRSFERVGGEETLEADVRLVAATNRDLAEAIRRGAFREDLFYRLNVIPIAVPPLRERLEDVPVLTALFLARAAAKLGRISPEISSEALSALLAYPWPGNVRELENLMERLAVLVPRDRIEAADLPEVLRGGTLPTGGRAQDDSLDALERARIHDVLRACGGNKKLAAARLGIHRSTLYAKLDRYRR
ncbi:MAG TPA: sigma-54 dependent transcriptional regulator [Candidatus Polarisedimenticolaceae bacterium]|nr:sigma-54 dependent transcriptional regulator [Candidatus Polarisedimenticolaceae bacterium]